ncbi:hypothetical protein ACEWPM_012055 [Roseovarius sp. S4756]|uniref:hypothetical protein n=1 Tax=Roseovarius maritimus TaxID=3342637 RepID=UPI003728C24D
MNEDPTIEAARISRGGLYYRMQSRLGLVEEDQLRPVTRALLFVLIAWGAPVVISIFEGSAFGDTSETSFLLHLPVLSRFLVGISLLIAMEPVAERQLAAVLNPLLSRPLLATGSQAAAASAATLAVRRRNSSLAEIICFLIACGFSVGAAYTLGAFDEASWVFTIGSGGDRFSYTALWCLWVSSPIYFFLVARWIWRIVVVGLFLKAIAALELRLTVTHPDGAGGLGFVGAFPNTYTLFVLALSCNLGAAIAGHLNAETISATTFTAVMVIWVLITNGLLALPMLFFTGPLQDLQQRTQDIAQAQATRYHIAQEHSVLQESISKASEDEISSERPVSDPGAIFKAARNLSTVLIQRMALLPISAAAVLPVFAAGATQLPLKDLFQILRKLLLF